MSDRETDWQRIVREAREQQSAELLAEDGRTLPAGTVTAWSEKRFGKTNDLSLVHRAGQSYGETQTTLCGDVIPAPLLRLALSPNFIRVLGRCRYCEEAYNRTGVAA